MPDCVIYRAEYRREGGSYDSVAYRFDDSLLAICFQIALLAPNSALFRNSVDQQLERRRNGGGRSLGRTALCDYFPVTGKNTGNFLDSGLVAPMGNGSIPLYSRYLLHSSPQSSL
jgi:hypothetical protein